MGLIGLSYGYKVLTHSQYSVTGSVCEMLALWNVIAIGRVSFSPGV